MNFTINDVDQVIERTGCSYAQAKQALMEADGDVVDAIIYLENQDRSSFGSFFRSFSENTERTADSIAQKMADAVKAGNVNKIEVRNSQGEKVFSLSLAASAAIGTIALLSGGGVAAFVAGLVAKYGLNYQFVIVKSDGSETIL